MASAKAMRPEDVLKKRKESIPNIVIDIFNKIIIENFSGSRAVVKQNEVVDRIVNKGIAREEIYKHGWLDVEGIFRDEGWKVEYDKPSYGDNYDAYFVFSAK